ncbi:MAG: hypothetical protein AAGA23_17765 [Pseudomonadota bacterium]
MKRLVTSVAALGLLAAGSVASACTLDAWSSRSGTVPQVGGPGDTVELARYSGVCAMQADSGVQYVQDNSPSTEGTFIARFYFLASGTGDATIFQAYSDDGATGIVFTVSADGTNVTLDPAGSDAISAPMSSGWNSVEVSYANSGNTFLWVNSDATSAAADAQGTAGASGTIESVRLGAVEGLDTFDALSFDQYESRRTTEIGRELAGDATGDSTVNIVDAVGVLQEVVNSTAQSGQPDCTEDGQVNIVDAICIVQIIVNG